MPPADISAAARAAYTGAMRRPLVVLLALLVLLGGGSFALWFWTVGRLAAGFDAWAADAQAQGWTVQAAGRHRAGWPLAAELVLDGVTLRAGPEVLPGGAEYRAGRVVLHISPLSPDLLTLRLEGTQSLRAFGGPALPFTADQLGIDVPLATPEPVRLSGHQLRFTAPAEGMTIGLLDGQAQPGREALTLELSGEAITLPPPPAPQPALGGHIASVTVTAALDGALPPPGGDPQARLAAWQHAGGMLRVQDMALGWGPLGVTGTAAIGLDAGLQPTGTATLRVVGYDAALSALAAGHVVTPQAAQAIRAVLALMARTPEGGGIPQVDLPVALEDGVLRVGRIPVGKVPQWDWSAAR